ncbi:hypothetical protein VPH35_062689 [Triticum aestivum]|uniref:F-box associated domain-containing protein n=1 Tax=Aegilops tauschii TaxID=37682 RepID=M8C720_AEGTA
MAGTAQARSRRVPVLPEEVIMRQPSLPLIRFDGKDINKGGFFSTLVDAFDLRQAPGKRRRPLLGFRNHRGGHRVVLHASCDGLLLLQVRDRFHICNPATRQWVSLPALKDDAHIAGLYPHDSSGEYRVLY